MAREFKSLETQLEIYGGLIVQRLADGLDANNTNASGALKGSIELTVKGGASGMFVDALDYWGAVDGGTRPHTPPLTPLMKWLSYPNVRDKIRFGASDKAFGEKEMKSLAYLIQRKIGREGTKGTNFAKNVMESDLIDQMVGALGDAAFEDFSRMVGEIVDNYNKQ